MYQDKKQRKKRWTIWLLLLGLIAGLLWLTGNPENSDAVRAQSAAAIREAVMRGAQQCYAVEGIYPPDLDYLQAHYGVQINTDAYYVVYNAFSSNLPPDIRVLPK